LKEKQTRAVEFSRNNRSSHTNQPGHQPGPALLQRRCVPLCYVSDFIRASATRQTGDFADSPQKKESSSSFPLVLLAVRTFQ
ncbi:hypothetical protein, partial [Nocardiopsis rhodophaea]